MAQHIVEVDHDHYNVLRLTEASRAVLRGDERVELRMQVNEPRRRAKGGRVARSRRLDDAAARVFARLREWRAGIAKEHGVPAYVVFHDGTLRAVAAQRPRSLETLGQVSGVGAAKLERYGAAVLQLVGEDGKG